MRAVYLGQKFNPGELIELKDDKAHHLVNVLRIKIGEKVLLLDGRGAQLESEVVEVSKKSISIQTSDELISRDTLYSVDLAIGQLKKEAMDLVIKSSCELGVKRIFILETKFSQRYALNDKRIEKLLISGLEQSNHRFLPKLSQCKIAEIPFNDYDLVATFATETSSNNMPKLVDRHQSVLLVIGPEAGFDPSELQYLQSKENTKTINLPTPIMRAPTAFHCAVGYVISRFDSDS